MNCKIAPELSLTYCKWKKFEANYSVDVRPEKTAENYYSTDSYANKKFHFTSEKTCKYG